MGSAMEAITVQRVLHGRAEKILYKNKKASVPNFGAGAFLCKFLAKKSVPTYFEHQQADYDKHHRTDEFFSVANSHAAPNPVAEHAEKCSWNSKSIVYLLSRNIHH